MDAYTEVRIPASGSAPVTFLVVVREENDSYFWQVQEGARKRTPVASGICGAADALRMIERARRS